jgi:hypothetical protein
VIKLKNIHPTTFAVEEECECEVIVGGGRGRPQRKRQRKKQGGLLKVKEVTMREQLAGRNGLQL